MRVNKFIALHTELSRRKADDAILHGRVLINDKKALAGDDIKEEDIVLLDGIQITSVSVKDTVVLVNKPVGYVCSHNGQGAKTIYNLLPAEYQNLKIAGRLDKDSSGLVLMTNNGNLLQELTHPSKEKNKLYEVILNKPLSYDDEKIVNQGVKLKDGISKLSLKCLNSSRFDWQITMHEGRNRQIRRTFLKIGYQVIALNRLSIGEYSLENLGTGLYKIIA